MKHLISRVALTLVLAASCVSCDKIGPPLPEVQKPPAATEERRKQEEERTAFVQAAQKELDALQAVIMEFKAQAESANLQTKARLAAELEQLEVGLRETQQRLADLKSATLDSWMALKEILGQSLEKLKNGIENFRKDAG
jgi:chromosome segregation ATPase